VVRRVVLLIIASIVIAAFVGFLAPDWSAAARHLLRNLARAF
jgi:hypothetical protein